MSDEPNEMIDDQNAEHSDDSAKKNVEDTADICDFWETNTGYVSNAIRTINIPIGEKFAH